MACDVAKEKESLKTKDDLALYYTDEHFRGSGAFGNVHVYGIKQKYDHTELRKRIAVKSLREDDSKTANREISILSKLTHEQHIVTMIGHCRSPGSPYLIFMECCNSDLHTYVRNRKFALSQRDLFKIIKDMLRGLIALMQHGVIHRDVKPRNFLVDFCGSDGFNIQELLFKLCDFGCGRPIRLDKFKKGEYPELTMNWGTNGYSAPELFLLQGGDLQGLYTYLVDIWGFGATLLWIVSGGQRPLTEDFLRRLEVDINSIPKRNSDIEAKIRECVPDSFQTILPIILEVLQWKAEDRKSPEQVLTLVEYFEKHADSTPKKAVIVPQPKAVNVPQPKQVNNLHPVFTSTKVIVPNEARVKKMLGHEGYDIIMDWCDEDSINATEMLLLAKNLDAKGRLHADMKKEMENNVMGSMQVHFRKLLSMWYKMYGNISIQRLIEGLDDPEVHLKGLAMELSNVCQTPVSAYYPLPQISGRLLTSGYYSQVSTPSPSIDKKNDHKTLSFDRVCLEDRPIFQQEVLPRESLITAKKNPIIEFNMRLETVPDRKSNIKVFETKEEYVEHELHLDAYHTFDKASNVSNKAAKFLLVVDQSGSMAGNPWKQVQSALKQILQLTKNTETTCTIIAYNVHATTAQLTGDSDQDKSTIARLRATGLTDFVNVFDEIRNIFAKCKNPEDLSYSFHIFFMTDGNDTCNSQLQISSSQEELKTEIGKSGAEVTFHVIGFSADHNLDFLLNLRHTGTLDGTYTYISPSDGDEALNNHLVQLVEATANTIGRIVLIELAGQDIEFNSKWFGNTVQEVIIPAVLTPEGEVTHIMTKTFVNLGPNRKLDIDINVFEELRQKKKPIEGVIRSKKIILLENKDDIDRHESRKLRLALSMVTDRISNMGNNDDMEEVRLWYRKIENAFENKRDMPNITSDVQERMDHIKEGLKLCSSILEDTVCPSPQIQNITAKKKESTSNQMSKASVNAIFELASRGTSINICQRRTVSTPSSCLRDISSRINEESEEENSQHSEKKNSQHSEKNILSTDLIRKSFQK